MKRIYILGLLISLSTCVIAQYKDFTIKKSDYPNVRILQIDNRDLSTLIHFQFTEKESGFRWISINEDFSVIDVSNKKKYKLLHSVNLPFLPKKHVNDKVEQIHNFSLEFERIPEGVEEIDIIENIDNGFNFHGVKIDWNKKSTNFIDLSSFVEETPIKEFGSYYKDDKTVLFYNYKGIKIAVTLTESKDYGKYYQANILIRNQSGKDLDFNPNLITSQLQLNGETIQADVLNYSEYMNKVQKRQNWAAVALAISESLAASDAAYSSTATYSNSNGFSNSSGIASGYVGNTYGSIYGISSMYNSTYSTSYSRTYDGAAAYFAQQNANRNISNYQNQQYAIKNILSDSYARLNTLESGTQYTGCINIKYRKADRIFIFIPFFDTNFLFFW